jgi:hypothetical protein
MIEAKDQTDPIGYEPIAKLRVQLQRRPGFVLGVVFSREGFTLPAKQLARMTVPHSVLLWEGSELTAILSGRFNGGMRDALRLKVRYAIEHAFPDGNVAPRD